jgi:hypothetical protein
MITRWPGVRGEPLAIVQVVYLYALEGADARRLQQFRPNGQAAFIVHFRAGDNGAMNFRL